MSNVVHLAKMDWKIFSQKQFASYSRKKLVRRKKAKNRMKDQAVHVILCDSIVFEIQTNNLPIQYVLDNPNQNILNFIWAPKTSYHKFMELDILLRNKLQYFQ